MDRSRLTPALAPHLLLGLLAVCLVASSNYVLNGLLDAPSDAAHPTKWDRPAPSGRIHVLLAYAQWIALMLAGMGLAVRISTPFALSMAGLWVMGCLYNLPPVRLKDLAYLDVLSEGVNNPLRMLAGWYLTGTAAVPTTSLLISYWMIGCYFMAIKRFAEHRVFNDAASSAAYRKSFAHYTQPRLLVSIMFYGSHAMLFFGAFIMRYRLELIVSFPLVAWVMASYLSMAFRENSAAQHPEHLYREPRLMLAVCSTTVVMLALLFIDLPVLHRIFVPTVPR
jgi:4-hydroxybenzoate polyprenyltransferase